MKNLVYIFLSSLVLISCNEFDSNSDQNQIYSPEFKKFKNTKELEIINLDSIDNFADLRSEVGKVACNKKIAGLKFRYENIIYNVTGRAECPTSTEISCYFRMNTIIIKNDSLVPDLSNRQQKIPIENLEKTLNNIISIPYNYEYEKDILRPALIHIYIEEKYPISKTKKVLKEIIEQFEKINSVNKTDFFKYIILINQFDLSNIPLPPPLPENS